MFLNPEKLTNQLFYRGPFSIKRKHQKYISIQKFPLSKLSLLPLSCLGRERLSKDKALDQFPHSVAIKIPLHLWVLNITFAIYTFLYTPLGVMRYSL